MFLESTYALISRSLPSLCSTKTTKKIFGKMFEKTFMHFIHFIKPQEQKLLAQGYLPFFMACGTAVLGANCQPGVDAVYPYMYNNTMLSCKDVSFILIQVKKNNLLFDFQDRIFASINPFKCGILNKLDCMDGNFLTPIICIIFTLCNKPSTDLEVVH